MNNLVGPLARSIAVAVFCAIIALAPSKSSANKTAITKELQDVFSNQILCDAAEEKDLRKVIERAREPVERVITRSARS